MNTSANHTRVNNILLGPLERPTLKWLAAHSPRWMTPDVYTAIGALGSVVSILGYFLSRFHPAFLWLATLGFIANWYGDSLDGTVARYRHIERPIYGFFVDHVLDAVSQVLFFIGLGISPYISFNVACLALIAFLLMTTLIFLRTSTASEFRISYNMLGPTEARVLAILLNTAMFFFGRQVWPVSLGALGSVTIKPYDVCLGALALLLLYFFTTTAIAEGVRLAKAGK